MEFKEITTEDGLYHVAKESDGMVYTLSIDSSEADEAVKQSMKDIIDGQIEIAASMKPLSNG